MREKKMGAEGFELVRGVGWGERGGEGGGVKW